MSVVVQQSNFPKWKWTHTHLLTHSGDISVHSWRTGNPTVRCLDWNISETVRFGFGFSPTFYYFCSGFFQSTLLSSLSIKAVEFPFTHKSHSRYIELEPVGVRQLILVSSVSCLSNYRVCVDGMYLFSFVFSFPSESVSSVVAQR